MAKRVSCYLLSVLLFSSFTLAQGLPTNFTYKRETGEKTGIPIFMLQQNVDAVAFDAKHGNGFEALGAIIQPERDKYGSVFITLRGGFSFPQIVTNHAQLKSTVRSSNTRNIRRSARERLHD